jgi:hypothetical protein
MRPDETIPGIGGEGIKYNDGVAEFNYVYCETFVNVTMYPQCISNMIIKYNNIKQTNGSQNKF